MYLRGELLNPKRLNLLLWCAAVSLGAACVALGYYGVTAPLDMPRSEVKVAVSGPGGQEDPGRDVLPTLEELAAVGGLELRQKLIDEPVAAAEPKLPALVPPAPKLDLRLTGTVIESDRPYAILNDARGIARLVRVGDEVKEAKVLSITPDSITLSVNEQQVTLEVAAPPAPGSKGSRRR